MRKTFQARRMVLIDPSSATAARTAANLIDMELWVDAYMELHAAARICWERRNEQGERPNDQAER